MYIADCWLCKRPFTLNGGYYFRYRWYCSQNHAEVHTGVRIELQYRPE